MMLSRSLNQLGRGTPLPIPVPLDAEVNLCTAAQLLVLPRKIAGYGYAYVLFNGWKMDKQQDDISQGSV